MPQIVLYGVPVSAFVAKVRIVLDLKGLAYDEQPPPDGYGSTAYRQIVPAGSVPGLVIDGQSLHDSNAIIEYLDETVPDPVLMPTDPVGRARVRALLGFHDTRLEAAARTLFAPIKAGGDADPAQIAAGFAAINAALERLGDLVGSDQPFMAGTHMTLADCAYPATLQMCRRFGQVLNQPVAIPGHITAIDQRLRANASIKRSLTIAGEALDAWIAQFRP